MYDTTLTPGGMRFFTTLISILLTNEPPFSAYEFLPLTLQVTCVHDDVTSSCRFTSKSTKMSRATEPDLGEGQDANERNIESEQVKKKVAISLFEMMSHFVVC